jgi:hypothetical protein
MAHWNCDVEGGDQRRVQNKVILLQRGSWKDMYTLRTSVTSEWGLPPMGSQKQAVCMR